MTYEKFAERLDMLFEKWDTLLEAHKESTEVPGLDDLVERIQRLKDKYPDFTECYHAYWDAYYKKNGMPALERYKAEFK